MKEEKLKREVSFNDIPVEVVEYKLDESEQVCDNCHRPLTVMKKEIRKELVAVPAEIKVIEHVTYVYSCRNCDKNGESADAEYYANAYVDTPIVATKLKQV